MSEPDLTVAPHPGDRAPDVVFSDGRTLFQALSTTTAHVLLLFNGILPTADSYGNLIGIANTVRKGWGDQIQVHGVVLEQQAPHPDTESGSVLLDPDGRLHNRYGATAACLYLIRPDGYIGFRSQPADRNALFDYLDNIFTLDQGATAAA